MNGVTPSAGGAPPGTPEQAEPARRSGGGSGTRQGDCSPGGGGLVVAVCSPVGDGWINDLWTDGDGWLFLPIMNQVLPIGISFPLYW